MTPFYDRDGITIYNADCADVLPTIDPSDVAMVLTDPPYGQATPTDYSAIAGIKPMSGTRAGGGHTYPPIEGDAEPFDPTPLLAFGRCILFGANHYADRLPIGRWVFWHKTNASPLMSAGELAWHNCGGRPVTYFATSIKDARLQDGHLHPAQKPVGLMRWLLESFTEPGDLILDPYMGSGPVAQACADLGRRYVGVELVEEYCRAAVGRLSQQVLDLERAAAR